MPRRPRVFVEGGIYHVYNRFARGADLFSEPEEAIEFIEILRKARDRDDLRIYAWTLMPNHYHLAARAGPVPLSRTMGYVQARFGQGYNRRHRSSWTAMAEPVQGQAVETPESFGRLIVYIHLNPWRQVLWMTRRITSSAATVSCLGRSGYSNVARGKRRRQAEAAIDATPADGRHVPSVSGDRDRSPDARALPWVHGCMGATFRIVALW